MNIIRLELPAVTIAVYEVFGHILMKHTKEPMEQEGFQRYIEAQMREIFFDDDRVTREDLIEYLVKQRGFMEVTPVEFDFLNGGR